MNGNNIDRFIRGLEMQGQLYEKLHDVMQKEMDALCSEDKNSMLSFFKEKLNIMKKLEDEDALIADIKNQWKDLIDKKSPEHERVQSLLKNMESMLKEILEMEEKSSRLIDSFKKDFDDVASKTKAIRASKAYKDQGAF